MTGGAGFIGSNLAEALLAAGHRVVVLDNFSTGKRENLAAFVGHPAFTLIEGDIRDFSSCRAACAGADYVLHHAALGSVPRSVADPVTSNDVNVGGFVNMLAAARECGIRRFIYASSSSVYGDEPTLPKVEERTGCALSPYAVSKQAGELYAANFSTLYGLETIGLRYFNVFGPRQDSASGYAAVIPKFAAALLHHVAPTINGDGSASRDFTFVANVIRANLLSAFAPSCRDRVFNIACGGRITLNELFFALRGELAAWDPAIAGIQPQYGPVRIGDIPHSLADISRAGRQLGYEPVVSFGEGLRRPHDGSSRRPGVVPPPGKNGLISRWGNCK